MEQRKTVYYVVGWGKDKQRAWSGTYWGLFSALQRVMDVRDIDDTIPDHLHTRILRKLHILHNDMGTRHIRRATRLVLPITRKEGPRDAVIQFEEVLRDDQCHMPTYIYIDLSVDAVADMLRNRPDDFAVSNYQHIPEFKIINRGGYRTTTCVGAPECSPWADGWRGIWWNGAACRMSGCTPWEAASTSTPHS